ncbi:unnamed protein product [Toxocara canis]|uniref:Methyltransferase HEMK2 n=1 Tax=Toxocara canis TaxID=6265 RepID=A0A183V241_TOXCA|nr:unnamed protein product [Toxocara canis]
MRIEGYVPAYVIGDDQRETVYEPAEDTFLLLDALEKEATLLRERDVNVIVEVGCGSGVVSTFAVQLLDRPVCALATDVNFAALQCTKHTAKLNRVDVDTVMCDLLSALSPRLRGLVDVLLFNPPYVPTMTPATDDASRCWAGGPSGRETLDRLLKEAPDLLSSNGLIYVVALKANNIPQLLEHSQLLKGSVVLERRCGIEYLYVLKFGRLS